MYVTEPKGEWPDEDPQKHRFQRPRWVDVTYESRTFKVACRVESRFHRGKAPVVMGSVQSMDSEPGAKLEQLIAAYPQVTSLVMLEGREGNPL